MNILGIGFSELILIFIIALMIFGPQRLPVYAGRIGRKLREWRMMSQVFLVEWREELAALEEARQSLEEARRALVEAQETVTTEVKDVTYTVSSEMSGAQADISAELAQAKAVVDSETAQVKATASASRQSKAEIEQPELIDRLRAKLDAKRMAAKDKATGVSETAALAESDISDVVELDENELEIDVVAPSPQPPAGKTATGQPTASGAVEEELDVSAVKTVSDVAAEVAEKIAQTVAAEVAEKVAKNMAAEVAEEAARLVVAKITETNPDLIPPTASEEKSESPLEQPQPPAIITKEVINE
ncbi:MAG: twin-arginine translocase TatA/TatE family subunit [Anaerolineae bacterium]|nr:twin-arginine translocase TatA/TatE family subunit [Anaerolineae bacterium]